MLNVVWSIDKNKYTLTHKRKYNYNKFENLKWTSKDIYNIKNKNVEINSKINNSNMVESLV